MNPTPPPNNNQPKKLVRPSWTPEERKLWLAAKGAPPGMMLVTAMEWAILDRQLRGEHNTGLVLRKMIEGAADVLDDYWRTEPDIENACASAVFDARRYARSAERAESVIETMISTCATLANMTDGGCDAGEAEKVILPIINEAVKEMTKVRDFMVAQRTARRERIVSATTPPEAKPDAAPTDPKPEGGS